MEDQGQQMMCLKRFAPSKQAMESNPVMESDLEDNRESLLAEAFEL